jgi:hypothetical protein
MPASAPVSLTAKLALLSAISFGGFPTVLPDVRATPPSSGRPFPTVSGPWERPTSIGICAMLSLLPAAKRNSSMAEQRARSECPAGSIEPWTEIV